jgi:hypothetical protein
MSALLERKTITKMSSLLTEIAANFDAKCVRAGGIASKPG